jgi:hypothetical protein
MAWNIFSCLCISLEKRVGPLLKTGDRGQGRDRVTQLHEMEKKKKTISLVFFFVLTI